jgi:hypothetical protein
VIFNFKEKLGPLVPMCTKSLLANVLFFL